MLSSVTQPCSSSLPVKASVPVMLFFILYTQVPQVRFCSSTEIQFGCCTCHGNCELLFHLPCLELVKYLILKWITNLRPRVLVICSCFIMLILPLVIDFKLKLNFAKIRYQDVKRHGASLPYDPWSMEWSGPFTEILS